MPGKRERQALEREARLEKIAEQVAAGTLRVRWATPAERAAWPSSSAPRRRGASTADGDRADLLEVAVRVLRSLEAPAGVDEVDRAIRALPDRPRFSTAALRDSLAAWAADPGSSVVRDSGGYTVRST